jgi:hypothetical protein
MVLIILLLNLPLITEIKCTTFYDPEARGSGSILLLRMESCQLLSTTVQDPIIYRLLVLY